jgi:predicted P-loop ATPase
MTNYLLNAAIEYANKGWKIFPVKKNSKRPHPRLAQDGYKCATNDIGMIKVWWKIDPNANIGLNLEASGLVCLDADTYKKDCSFDDLCKYKNIPQTLQQRSAHGGTHLIFSCDTEDAFPGQIGISIDIKHKGYILLAPSEFEGQKYKWENDHIIAQVPDWLKGALSGSSPRKTEIVNNGSSCELWPPFDLFRALDDASKGIGWYDNVLRSVASMVAQGYSDDKIHSFTDSVTLEGYRITETRGQVQKLIDSARKKGFDDGSVQRLENNLYHLDLSLDRKGDPICNHLNISKILLEHSDWKGTFGFNTFCQTEQVFRALPGETFTSSATLPRLLSDGDYTQICVWLNAHGISNLQKHIVIDAVKHAAMRNSINPVADYLDHCREHCLPPNPDEALDTWLEIYLGVSAETDADWRYLRAVSRISLIQAVARVREPGCKADTVVILEGEQGSGKSSAIRVLFGKDYFGDQLPPMSSKDASSYLKGKWCVELAELEYKRKAEVETIKAFITRTHENYRPAFAREEITLPRTNVFFGTTNATEYLVDETGNRRFLPILTGAIDLLGLLRARDGLWAAAAYAHSKGERHWLDEEISEFAKRITKLRLEQDPWVEIIHEKLPTRKEISINEAFQICFNSAGEKSISTADSRRMSKALLMADWKKDGRFNSGSKRNQTKFVNSLGSIPRWSRQ